MKLRLSTIGASLLLLAGAASAVNGSGYYNLISVGGYGYGYATYYLTQDAYACTDVKGSFSVNGVTYSAYSNAYGTYLASGVGPVATTAHCVASFKDTPENLNTLLTKNWIDPTSMVTDLNLGSDLDLAGFDEAGTCVNPHKPLPAVDSKGIQGNGYTIKNLCYETEKMTGSVGFISEVKKGNFLNIGFDGVKISVKGSSKNGKDYYPVGTLAGIVDSASVKSIKLSNVTIDAPFAGGVAGLAINSTVANSRATESISITNSLPITTGYAGSGKVDLATPYSVFLGGIAGVSTRSNGAKTDASLTADTVLVTVRDNASGHRSALGGVVGMIFASLDTYTGLKVISENDEKTSISGGSAMGGIVGYSSLLYINNSPIAADTCVLKLENSSFTGEIGNASSLDDIAVGGLVGRDSVLPQSRLNIARSVADITLKDSLATAGNYRYFAGGILGFSSNCTSASTDKDYLAIEKSVSKGSMELAGSDVAVSGLHAKVYMGGIAGAACFAVEPKALKEDTSSVKIVSKVKTTHDTLFVGGIVGSMNVGDNKGINLSALSFTGSVAVEDSLNEIYAGGVVGLYLGASGGKPIGFKDIAVSVKDSETSKRGDLITYSAMAESAPAGSVKKGVRLGGLCGYCREINNAEKIGIYGNINVQAESKYVGDSLFVGGLVGRYENTTAKMVIQKTYSVSDIMVNGSGNLTKVGYLLGLGSLTSSYKILSNYHYGEETDVDAFGFLTQSDISSIGSEITDWKTQESISYTIRNGATSTYGDNANKNGTALASEMQGKSFASLLNEPLTTTSDDMVWYFDKDVDESLPRFVKKNEKPTTDVQKYTVMFFLDEEETNLYDTKYVGEGEAAVLPDAPSVAGLEFNGWDKEADLENVTSDMVVHAVFDTIEYVVKFWGHRENDVETPWVAYHWDHMRYGESVPVPEQLEKMGGNAKYIEVEGLKFVGWDSDEYKNVTRDLNIYPVYDTIVYTVSFVNPDGSEAYSTLGVKYGTAYELPTAGVKAENDSMTYIFKEWKGQKYETMPAKDLEYTAVYDSTKKQYTVTYKDYDGAVLETVVMDYGSRVTHPAYKSAEDVQLDSWSLSSLVVKSDTTVTANVKFKVSFDMGDGQEPVVVWVENGKTAASHGGLINPTRKDTDEYTYTFSHWNQEFSTVTGAVTYVAVFDSLPVVSISSSSSAIELPESSSSHVPPESSSSDAPVVATGVKVMSEKGVEQSGEGNAIRVAYVIEVENPSIKTVAYVVLDDSVKYLIADSLETEVLEDVWVLAPAPLGNHSVKVVVDNGIESESVDAGEYTVAAEIAMAPKSWKMISMAEADGDLADLASKTSIYWWDEQNPIGEYWQYRAFEGEDFEATRGFWYGTSAGTPIALREGSATSEFVWNLDSLYSGWNMVSNPTGWMIDLEDVLNNKDVLQVRGWNAETGAYDPVTVLKPYEAVWVQVAHQTQVTVAATPFFGSEKKEETVVEKMTALRKGVARKASAKNWSVLAVLKDRNGKSDSWNMIGAGANVEILNKAPMGMGDYVRLAIMDGKNKLAKSVKTVADEYEWTMKLSAATGRDAELSFEGVDALNQAGLSMTVTINGKTQEVMAGTPVKVALTKNTTEAKVRVAPAATLAPSKMSGFAVAQVADGLKVGFNAPESLAGANASYALVTVNGKKIASGSFKATAGSNSLNLKVPQSGLYFVQLKVGSQMASAKVMVK
ncbi:MULTISPECIES: T9SS type A sorting domain-containing protein [unclassified Fibrobacter]|uniref:T9SS type A sorting domain-containing protein n=1 Tax=unclassified Fibrobacter TaxID=2634177 RepID=UPI000D78E84D|nr:MULTISPECIES: T9SS type A sorting domain-containing protein [unclassified Fibrobacter]PWJ64074.1 putative secreted protein (Por secretion system target) [Fibrobacter sp. UWR4]PZW69189.1 putative secreted protein (Por secretion system target) [Fibrobacter sp. UWR1]